MATYPPPSSTQRPRATSTSSGRYIPDNYRVSPGQAPSPLLGQPNPYPYGMPSAPIPPPMISNPSSSYFPPPPHGHYIPQENTLHPSAAATRPPFPTSATDPFPHRPTHERERRESRSSQHSRRSHDSHRSHKSHHSHRTASEDRERERRHRRHDREREHEHEHEHHRRHSDYDYDKPLKRRDTRSRSFGDTIFSLYDTLKDYLGPRDKY